jgi:hypothetical protein
LRAELTRRSRLDSTAKYLSLIEDEDEERSNYLLPKNRRRGAVARGDEASRE